MLTQIHARCESLGLKLAVFVSALVWNDRVKPSPGLATAFKRIPLTRMVQTPHSYTMPPELRKWAQARAKAEKINVSGYLCALILLDLERGRRGEGLMLLPLNE